MPWMANGQEVTVAHNKIEARNDPQGKLQGFRVLSDSSEKYGFYYVDGSPAFWMALKARPRGPIGKGRQRGIIKTLRVSPQEVQDLCQCRLTGPQYHALIVGIQQRGELPPNPR